MPLQVGVVGAGIGGLSAAIGLRRAGAEVEIFERSTFKNEVGAAITITPNGSRILDSWGFDHVKARVVEAKNLRMVDAHTLESAFVGDLKDVHTKFGANMGFYHRVDLHNTLKAMAESQEGQPGKPVTIKLGLGVVDVECEAGTIILSDGSKIVKDLVVLADGIRSRFVSKVTGKEEPLKEMGWSAYRCLIPMKDILSDDSTRPIFENQPAGYWTPFYLPDAFYMVAYPCRANEMLNIALRHTTQPKDRDKEDWNSPASHQDVLELLKNYNPLMGEIIKKAPDIKIYKLLRREPLETYTKGRAVIVGDAAHTILPTHAQGAVMAIEEAAALEVLFDGVAESSQVAPRLQLYSRLLKKHIHVIQHLSDTIPGTRDEYRQRAEELCDEGLFHHSAMNFTVPVQDFFYGFDVRKEIMSGMKEADMI
ncbi:hypothetical protein JX265_002551 [Neoarthrinium moseri]|uniref:FAD-binding domain-containing protein n=1 Tax=Neoarthrinium moseri TaxID=1658444 RepID=A0A9Q0ATL6_9PEZI|nr:hypothetical protein JX265_002551 [Neoarthrinium moseri]